MHVVLEILLISPQYVYNISLALYTLIAAILDILQLPMFAKKDKLKNSEIENTFLISFNTVISLQML